MSTSLAPLGDHLFDSENMLPLVGRTTLLRFLMVQPSPHAQLPWVSYTFLSLCIDYRWLYVHDYLDTNHVIHNRLCVRWGNHVRPLPVRHSFYPDDLGFSSASDDTAMVPEHLTSSRGTTPQPRSTYHFIFSRTSGHRLTQYCVEIHSGKLSKVVPFRGSNGVTHLTVPLFLFLCAESAGAITPQPTAAQIACQGAKPILLNTVSHPTLCASPVL